MKPLIAALLLGLPLLVLYGARAEAHERGLAVVIHQGKVVRKFRPELPHWLARDDAFRRWYVHGAYYRLHSPDWRVVYRRYRRDVAWHRHGHGHGHWKHRFGHHRRRH